MEKETICWGCQNFSKCSWSKGVPVENWDATPTMVLNYDGKENLHIVESYCVNSCPQFKADAKQRTSVREIAKIIGKYIRTVFRYLASKEKTLYLRELLKQKGYKLHICKEIQDDTGNCLRTYYLERVENESSKS